MRQVGYLQGSLHDSCKGFLVCVCVYFYFKILSWRCYALRNISLEVTCYCCINVNCKWFSSRRCEGQWSGFLKFVTFQQGCTFCVLFKAMTVKKYRFWSKLRSFRSQTNPRGICGRLRGIGIGFRPCTSVFRCQYHSANIQYSYLINYHRFYASLAVDTVSLSNTRVLCATIVTSNHVMNK